MSSHHSHSRSRNPQIRSREWRERGQTLGVPTFPIIKRNKSRERGLSLGVPVPVPALPTGDTILGDGSPEGTRDLAGDGIREWGWVEATPC